MAPTKDKQSRARSFQARLRAGGVKFDKQQPWYMEFEDEMVRFPRAKHDDQVDAVAWIGLVLDQIHDASTADEIETEQYMDFLRESDSLYSGRSMTTGY